MIKAWEAVIKLPGKPQQKTVVQAESRFAAKDLLEAQYGKGSVFGVITEVKK